MHRAAVVARGRAARFWYFDLPVDLPFSTTIMLRSIA